MFRLSGLLKAFSASFEPPLVSSLISRCYLALGIGLVVLSAVKSVSPLFDLGLGLTTTIPPAAEVDFVLRPSLIRKCIHVPKGIPYDFLRVAD